MKNKILKGEIGHPAFYLPNYITMVKFLARTT